MEILSADIKTCESHTFSFTKPIQQFMVGFSKCGLKYPRPDHHVLAVSIDLSDVRQDNNNLIVKPKLILHDNARHNQSSDSSVTVVVIATVGEGNPNVQLLTGIKPHFKNELQLEEPIHVLKPALSYTYLEYPDTGHHIYQLTSTIYPDLKEGVFFLRGQAHMNDHSKKGDNTAEGKIAGSVIIYNGDNQSVIGADFDSSKIGDTGNVCFGEVPEGFPAQNYQVGCFITGYDLQYSGGNDHHVLGFELSAESVGNLFVKDGKAYAQLNLKSYLTDNGKNQHNIPHNTLTGVVVAFNNRSG